MNHYDWLDKHFMTFVHALGLTCVNEGAIVCDGDKVRQYQDRWEAAGVPFFHGAAIYLITKSYPYCDEVRQTAHGWVDPAQWVIDNYHRFEAFLPEIQELVRISLPVTFYDDHVSRDLPSGEEISRKGNLVEVDLTEEELSEIESDARYYADKFGPSEISIGLKNSARATVKRIEKFREDQAG